MNLKDVWRTCNKIAVAIFRIGLDFWSYFLPLDPNKNCLISGIRTILITFSYLTYYLWSILQSPNLFRYFLDHCNDWLEFQIRKYANCAIIFGYRTGEFSIRNYVKLFAEMVLIYTFPSRCNIKWNFLFDLHLIVPNFANNLPLVDGLEWEDPLHINSLKSHEERQLNILITKIASLVNMRKLILKPYFQDYELVWTILNLNEIISKLYFI